MYILPVEEKAYNKGDEVLASKKSLFQYLPTDVPIYCCLVIVPPPENHGTFPSALLRYLEPKRIVAKSIRLPIITSPTLGNELLTSSSRALKLASISKLVKPVPFTVVDAGIAGVNDAL
jgi:hypothetical protein